MKRPQMWITLVVLLVSAGELRGQDLLRWNLGVGEVVSYRAATETVSATDGMGQSVEVRAIQALTMDGAVVSVDDDGNSTVEWTYSRIEMVMDAPPPIGGFNWDSADPDAGNVPPQMRAQVEPLSALVGKAITTVQTPMGDVTEVRGLQALMDDVIATAADPQTAAAMRMMVRDLASDEAIMGNVAGALATLPAEEVSQGFSWTTSRSQPNPLSGGRTTVDMENTIESIEERSGERVAVIRHSGEMELGAGDVPLGLEIGVEDSSMTGLTVFSIDRGRVLSSSLAIEFVMVMSMPSPAGRGGAADDAVVAAGGGQQELRVGSSVTVTTELLTEN